LSRSRLFESFSWVFPRRTSALWTSVTAKAQTSAAYLKTFTILQGWGIFLAVNMCINTDNLTLTLTCVYTHTWCTCPVCTCVPAGNTFSWLDPGHGAAATSPLLHCCLWHMYFPLITYIKDKAGKRQNGSTTYTRGGISAANACTLKAWKASFSWKSNHYQTYKNSTSPLILHSSAFWWGRCNA